MKLSHFIFYLGGIFTLFFFIDILLIAQLIGDTQSSIKGNKPLIWIESSSSSSFQSTVVKAFDCIDGEISNKVECHESDGLKCFVENSQQIGSQIVIEQKNLKKAQLQLDSFQSPFEFIQISILNLFPKEITLENPNQSLFIAWIVSNEILIPSKILKVETEDSQKFSIWIQHQHHYKIGDVFHFSLDPRYWTHHNLFKTNGNFLQDYSPKLIVYNFKEVDTLPWWLFLESQHINNIVSSLAIAKERPPFLPEYFSTLPHLARLSHYSFLVFQEFEKYAHANYKDESLEYFQVENVEYWKDFSTPRGQRALIDFRSKIGSEVIYSTFEIQDNHVQTPKVFQKQMNLSKHLNLITIFHFDEQLSSAIELLDLVSDISSTSLCLVTSSTKHFSKYLQHERIKFEEKLSSCTSNLQSNDLLFIFDIEISFPVNILETINRYVVKNQRAYIPIVFSPSQALLDPNCDINGTLVCFHQESWMKNDVGAIGVFLEDLWRAGGITPSFENCDQITASKLTNFSDFGKVDLFFRLRNNANLEILRPYDHSLRLNSHQFISESPSLKYTPLKFSKEKINPIPPPLKRPASFTTSLPTFKNYFPRNAFDTDIDTFFWSSRGADVGDYFQVTLEVPINCSEIKVYTGSKKQLFNWLRFGVLEVSSNGKDYETIFEFNIASNGVARVEKKLSIKSLRITAKEKQDAWLIIEDIILDN